MGVRQTTGTMEWAVGNRPEAGEWWARSCPVLAWKRGCWRMGVAEVSD